MPDQSNGARKPILVVGGGISGITTALEAAEVGYEVILIEKLPFLGGRVAQMNQYFPKLCPPWCGLEINFKRLSQNNRITIQTSTTVTNIEGEKGNFTVTLHSEPEYVNDNCTLCGECVDACPVERNNSFNLDIDKTKAIYLPHELTYPQKYIIDTETCLTTDCAKCRDICKYNAIDFDKSDPAKVIQVASIVFATGWSPYDISKVSDLSFNKSPDIISNLMMERLSAIADRENEKITRPSDGNVPDTIVFVQCAGSRDENYLPYCSGVCCSASLKQALYISEQNPESKIKIFYIDLRVSGRNESFLNRVIDNPQIELIKGKVGIVGYDAESGKLTVEAEDIMSGIKVMIEADLVILASGIVPNSPDVNRAKRDEHGFLPQEYQEEGIYSVGCSKKPQDVALSLRDATGAALKAIQSANIN